MPKLCRVTKVKVLFLVLVYVFNFNLFEFSAAILEKGLFLEHKLAASLSFFLLFTKDTKCLLLLIFLANDARNGQIYRAIYVLGQMQKVWQITAKITFSKINILTYDQEHFLNCFQLIAD